MRRGVEIIAGSLSGGVLPTAGLLGKVVESALADDASTRGCGRIAPAAHFRTDSEKP
jgi:hypothetical protein